MLGPEEFLEGVVLGGRQFVGGTVGGISGVLGKVTGVLGDTAASLTMDSEYQSQRKKARGSVGQSIEGAAKVRRKRKREEREKEGFRLWDWISLGSFSWWIYTS